MDEKRETCSYIGEKGKRISPAVECNYSCRFCGWNPAEHERRMSDGQWIKHGDVWSLHFDGGAYA